jgi:hypothetical protein
MKTVEANHCGSFDVFQRQNPTTPASPLQKDVVGRVGAVVSQLVAVFVACTAIAFAACGWWW